MRSGSIGGDVEAGWFLISNRSKDLSGKVGSIENQKQNGRLECHTGASVLFGLIMGKRNQI